jgi:four helix bundle protein
MYPFESLKAWQESVRLVEIVYEETDKFPKDEKFALVDQLKRAATSVSLNIAEGSGSRSNKGFCAGLEIAVKSLYETVSILKMAEMIFHKDFSKSLKQCDLLVKLIKGLIKSLGD